MPPPPDNVVFSAKVTLPTLDEAKIEIAPLAFELVNEVLAFPLASVTAVTVAVELDNRPPLEVVTVKVTVTPETALPFELVAITSRSVEAKVLGATIWPLPDEILSEEPVPIIPTESVKTALPAVEVAIIEEDPSLLEAVKVTLARPFVPVIAVALVAPPVSVPAPDVTISKDTITPVIGAPLLSTAKTSRLFGAVEFCSRIWLLPFATSSSEPDEPPPVLVVFELPFGTPRSLPNCELLEGVQPVIRQNIKRRAK